MDTREKTADTQAAAPRFDSVGSEKAVELSVPPPPGQSTAATAKGAPAAVIPVVEERVVVDRRSVETGRVLVHRHIEEERVIIERPVQETAVEVERREINEFVDQMPTVRSEDDAEGNEIIVVPVVEEVLVVQKRLMLKEEVRLVRRTSERMQRKVETVRRQDVDVTRESAASAAGRERAREIQTSGVTRGPKPPWTPAEWPRVTPPSVGRGSEPGTYFLSS
jgi:uncharacterized protein (TIGR02271 family)